MQFSVNDVTALLKLAAAAGGDAKGVSRLVSLEVLRSLGAERYLVSVEGKPLQANSDVPLKEHGRYWGELTAPAGKTPHITRLLPRPPLLDLLAPLPARFEPEALLRLLSSPHGASTLKAQLGEQLAAATTKEEFTALGNLLLSLGHNVLTLPVYYDRYLGVFQMKKQYNKPQRKHQVVFYAALNRLGPLEGTLSESGEGVDVQLDVAFGPSVAVLEQHRKALPGYIRLHIRHEAAPQPLWEAGHGLLDISA